MEEWGKGGGTENSFVWLRRKIEIENVVCINLL